MFTKGQVQRMRAVLQADVSLRNNIVSIENNIATGINTTTATVCTPNPDIFVDSRYTCVDEKVQFTDKSTNGTVTSYFWEFEDATPSTSTDANPEVVFNTPGKKTITLTVGNSTGNNKRVFENYIDVQPLVAAYSQHKTFDFETTDQYDQLYYYNEGETYSKFIPSTRGYGSKGAVKLTVQRDISEAPANSPLSRYYLELGGQVDAIITPSFDLTNLSEAYFTFAYSYATNAPWSIGNQNMTEAIRVYYSRNCGKTWSLIGNQNESTIRNAALASGGIAGLDYAPSTESDWKIYTKLLNVTSNDDRTRFKIEFTAADHSGNLYIDNIGVVASPPQEKVPTPLHHLPM